jgi:hypothetical protein
MADLAAFQTPLPLYDYDYKGTEMMWGHLGHTLLLITDYVRSGQTRGIIAIRSATESELPSIAQVSILTSYMPRVIDGKLITFEQLPDNTFPAQPSRPHQRLFEWKVRRDLTEQPNPRILSVPIGITSTAYTLTF